MNTPQKDRIISLMEQILENEAELAKIFSQLNPEEQKAFLPKIMASHESTKAILETLK